MSRQAEFLRLRARAERRGRDKPGARTFAVRLLASWWRMLGGWRHKDPPVGCGAVVATEGIWEWPPRRPPNPCPHCGRSW